MLSLDSSTITLCLQLFPWAKFRRAKGGVKVHVLLDHDHYMPSFVLMSKAKSHDATAARQIPLNPGSIVAMDRGHNDYALFGTWTAQGIYFVTRLKDNAVYEVIKELPVPKVRARTITDARGERERELPQAEKLQVHGGKGTSGQKPCR